MVLPRSGEQLHLRHGDWHAAVALVGGTLRQLEFGGSEVLAGFAASELSPAGHGQVLAPWPNRLADGRFHFGSRSARAALDEPDRHNAIHGLVRWLAWSVIERGTHEALVGCMLEPQPGYPWRCSYSVRYTLHPNGLSVEVRAKNEDEEVIPLAVGFHPYVSAGSHAGAIDGCRLAVDAPRRLTFDQRGLPTGSESVAGTSYDLRGGSGRSLEGLELDDCYTHLELEDDGYWRARLFRPLSEGTGATGDLEQVTVYGDASLPYLMCFTSDTLSGRDRRRAIAIEPMTSPPNALRTGHDLVVLEPGTTFSARWGIELPGLEPA